MTSLKEYFNDGANYQAKAVLKKRKTPMSELHEKKVEAVKTVVNFLRDPDSFSKAIRVMFRKTSLPSDKWSLFNRIICFINGARDGAGGKKQLEKMGFIVKENAKEFGIFAPYFKRVEDKDNPKKEVTKRVGYIMLPVYDIKQCDATDEAKKKLQMEIPKTLPLLDIAKKIGVKVTAGVRSDYTGPQGLCGTFNKTNKEITLYTYTNEKGDPVWFHELGHGILDFTNPKRKMEKDVEDLIVELYAIALCGIYDTPISDDSKIYIKNIINKREPSLMMVLKNLEKMLLFTFDEAEPKKEKKNGKRKLPKRTENQKPA